MSEEAKVRLKIDDGVATVTFDRPRVKNSLDVEALEQFFEALGTCEDRDDVGARASTEKRKRKADSNN